jgi:hypothetical protein
MTATVDFIIDSRENVLMVPNTALKIKPTEKMLADAREARRAQMEQLPIPSRLKSGNVWRPGARKTSLRLSYRNPNVRPLSGTSMRGQTLMTKVKTGLSDSKNTEILENPELKEGQKIIVALSNNGTKTENNSTTNRSMMGVPAGDHRFNRSGKLLTVKQN